MTWDILRQAWALCPADVVTFFVPLGMAAGALAFIVGAAFASIGR